MNKLMIAGLLAGTLFGGAALAAQTASTTDTAQRTHRTMPKVDTDGNGAISRAEMLAAAEARFAKRDVDGNGELSAAEMRGKRMHRRHRGHHGRHRHDDMLKRLDANGDGVVTRAEAETAGAARATKRFDRLDANKDGRIDQAEVAQVRAEMKAKRKARWEQRKARRAAAAQPAGE